MKNAITKLGDILGQEALGLINVITDQNKLDKKTLNPIHIHITGAEVTDNADELEKAVELMESDIAEVITNALSLSEVSDTKKNLASIITFLVDSRKEITAPLDKIKGKFTPLESRMKKLIDDLKKKEDEIKEQDYQLAEKTIRAEFKVLIDNLDGEFTLNAEVFNDFISAKRKIKGMLPNAKGNLSAASLKQIKEQFDMIVAPLVEAKRIDDMRASEQTRLAKDLSDIETSGTVEVLNLSMKKLQEALEAVDMYYPNIADNARLQIESNMRIIEANIRAENANAEKMKQVSNDDLIMQEFYFLDFASNDIDSLQATLSSARELRSKLILAENIKKIDAIGSDAKEKLIRLKAEKLVPKAEPVEDPVIYPTQKEAERDHPILTGDTSTPGTTKFTVSIDDLEVLAGITVEAESEDEAKKIFVGHFMAHLDMINLNTKEQ